MTQIAKAIPSVEKWIKEQIPTPSDLAMDAFRKQFKMICNCHVSLDGKRMTYTFPLLQHLGEELIRAHKIIQDNRLPLLASGYSHYTSHILSIKFYL